MNEDGFVKFDEMIKFYGLKKHKCGKEELISVSFNL